MLDAKEKDEMRAALRRLVDRAEQFIGLFLQEQFEKLDAAWEAVPVKPATPDVGEGWREIRTGEHAEHLAKGDWVQDSNGCWEPIHGFMIGGFGSPSHRYIRRLATPELAEAPQPDVGEGWRLLRVGDVVQIGDEFLNETGWHVTTIEGGRQIGPKNFPYRRRVTPEAEAPLGAFLDEENNQLRAENSTLRSGVELLGAEASTLRNEVERLRLTEEELVAIKLSVREWDDSHDTAGHKFADTLRALLERIGGGE